MRITEECEENVKRILLGQVNDGLTWFPSLHLIPNVIDEA
jgi:hypothetical protein